MKHRLKCPVCSMTNDYKSELFEKEPFKIDDITACMHCGCISVVKKDKLAYYLKPIEQAELDEIKKTNSQLYEALINVKVAMQQVLLAKQKLLN